MTNQIVISRRAVTAAINLRSALAELQELAGKPLTGTQAVKYADELLDAITPLAQLAPKPLLLTSSKAPTEPPDILAALAVVLGNQTLDIAQITKLLQDQGWLHHTAGRPVRYVSDLLSRNSEGKGTNAFTRVRRGTYKVARPRPKLVYRAGP
jgi:hypothetical protein